MRQQTARTKHPDAVRAEAILRARKDRAARTVGSGCAADTDRSHRIAA
ncbi:hypothetical protein ACPCVL_28100 [Streptomyces koyangensis]